MTAPQLIGFRYARFRVAPGRIALPDVCCDLILADGALLLAGPSSRAFAVPPAQGEVQLVSLDALCVQSALCVPLQYLADRVVPLADIAPQIAAPLHELFVSDRAASLVRARPAVPPTRIGRAAAILAEGGSVGAAAVAVNWSVRQFERCFLEATGLRPTTYRRILRLRTAVRAARAGESLASAAQEAGFADQSHFTRDARALTALSPSRLLHHVANVQDEQTAHG